jgi:hypothetical protein
MKHVASSYKWQKHGLILTPAVCPDWAKSHISVPCAENLRGDIFRVYFCARDSENRNQIGYADININAPHKILKVSKQPILGLGPLGSFDDNGVTPTWILKKGSDKYLYYVGWNKGATVRMHLFVGLAISKNGGKFERFSNAPILERVKNDPFLTATLSIMKEKGVYRMWYISGDSWFRKGDETFPVYNVKYAESKDGIHWKRDGKVCVDYANPEEHALARPCVVKEDGIYKMWLSHKGADYRIGYAESKDGLKWNRMDEKAGISPTPGGFDSKMQEYAFVFTHQGKRHMFYNGDEYGKEGLGYASCEA